MDKNSLIKALFPKQQPARKPGKFEYVNKNSNVNTRCSGNCASGICRV